MRRRFRRCLVTAPIGEGHLGLLLAEESGGAGAELLALPSALELLDQATKLADVVVVDSPPLATVVDALPLARAVDEVVIALKLGTSRIDRTQELAELLADAGITPAGFVLIGVPRHSKPYYGDPTASRRRDAPESTGGQRRLSARMAAAARPPITWLAGLLAVGLFVVVGFIAGAEPKFGIVAALAIVYALIVFTNLAAALTVLVDRRLRRVDAAAGPALSATKIAGLLLALGWLARVATDAGDRRAVLFSAHPTLSYLLALFVGLDRAQHHLGPGRGARDRPGAGLPAGGHPLRDRLHGGPDPPAGDVRDRRLRDRYDDHGGIRPGPATRPDSHRPSAWHRRSRTRTSSPRSSSPESSSAGPGSSPPAAIASSNPAP